MRLRADITDLNPNEILHQMANELIVWGENVMTRDPEVVVDKTGDTEWEHGDNVSW